MASVGEILQRWWKTSQSPFSEQMVAEKTPIIQINASYKISELRDRVIEEGTGAVTNLDSEYQLTISAAGDKTVMVSASRGRYTPGCAAEAGVGVRCEQEITGDAVVYWGYFDTDANNDIYDGIVFGKDIDGTFVALFREGVEEYKAYQKNWNQNKEIDLTKGNVFQIRFTYYGYGLIEWRVLEAETGSDKQITKTLHTYRPSGNPVLSNSNLRVGAMLYSTNDTATYDLFLSGRQFSILGKAAYKKRVVAHLTNGITVPVANYVPLMTFRKKSGNEAVPISIQAKQIITDNDIEIKWAVRVSLGDAVVWKNPSGVTASETVLEVNDDATTVDLTNALLIDQYQVSGGTPSTRGELVEQLSITDIPDEYNVCLVAKAKSVEATVDAVGKLVEER